MGAKNERQKVEYLIENVMRKNMDLLNQYCDAFNKDEPNEGLYIVDEGTCIVKSNLHDQPAEISDRGGLSCCKHWVKHLKQSKVENKIY